MVAAILPHTVTEHKRSAPVPSHRPSTEPVGSILGPVMDEIARRVKLRRYLETELGRPLSDREFIGLAERSGMRI